MAEVESFTMTAGHASAGGPVVLVAAGEIDMATAPAFRDGLDAHAGAASILLDLGAVSFLDSSGIRELDRIVGDPAFSGLRVVPGLHPDVRRVLEVVGLLEVLPFAPADDGTAAA